MHSPIVGIFLVGIPLAIASCCVYCCCCIPDPDKDPPGTGVRSLAVYIVFSNDVLHDAPLTHSQACRRAR